MTSYDIAIIGAGPGGMEAALAAREHGLKTVLIDKQAMGGTCLNTGCIPTKALLASSRLVSQIKRAAEFGIEIRGFHFDYKQMNAKKDEIVSFLRRQALTSIQKSGVEFIEGEAFLVSSHQIEIKGKEQLKAKFIIIATGSRPGSLPGMVPDGKNIISSDDALKLQAVPKSIAIVGGGAVGVEFASIFHALGSSVTIIEMMDRLIPTEDIDCAKRLEAIFSRSGIKVLTGKKIDKEAIQAEKILIAAGRQRNTNGLGLEKGGIHSEKNGMIPVNEFLETRSPGIFAIGDVIGSAQLAHVASYEGRLVIENIIGKIKQAPDYRAIPNCIYSDPEIASVGYRKKPDEDSNPNILEARIPFAGLGKARVERETNGFFKLVAEKGSGKVLGASAIGSHVTELIPEAALAIRLGLTVKDIADTVHAHPTESEILQIAAQELTA